MSEKQYYMFGIQRSGTNYLESLLNLNFVVKRINQRHRVWKHSLTLPKGVVNNVPLIIIYKNPYTWIESLSWRNRVDWSKTQKKYPVHEKGEMMIGENKDINLVNLAKTYSDFYNGWLKDPAVLDKSHYIVRYEDLLEESTRNKHLQCIGKEFEFSKRRIVDWKNPTPGSVSQSKSYNMEMQEYYKDMAPKNLTREHIDKINEIVGPELFEIMDYRVL